MHVHTAPERFSQMLVAAQMGHDSEFNLGVVRRENESVIVLRDESLPDLLSAFCPDRDVLEVRIG